FIGVPTSGVEGPAAIKFVIPGDGMVWAVLSSFVAGFVEFAQNFDAGKDAFIVVPLVGTNPAVREMTRRRVVFVFCAYCCFLRFGVTLDVRSNELVVPVPVVFRVRRRMSPYDAAAVADVPLKG